MFQTRNQEEHAASRRTAITAMILCVEPTVNVILQREEEAGKRRHTHRDPPGEESGKYEREVEV